MIYDKLRGIEAIYTGLDGNQINTKKKDYNGSLYNQLNPIFALFFFSIWMPSIISYDLWESTDLSKFNLDVLKVIVRFRNTKQIRKSPKRGTINQEIKGYHQHMMYWKTTYIFS